jgi:hypothetical protein
MLVASSGVSFRKEAFENSTYNDFKALYEFQTPFKAMTPKKREQALKDAWNKVKPEPKKQKKEVSE